MKIIIFLIFSLFLSICGLIIYGMYITEVTSILAWVIIILVTLALAITFFSIFFDIGRYQTIEEFNKYKDRLSYNNESFVIYDCFSNRIVKWETVEAVFFQDHPPREGIYYSKQYRIILNEEPVVIEQQSNPPKWYVFFNMILKILPAKEEKYPLITINDHHNINFNTFHSAIEEYLINGKIADNYLTEKFGNKVEYIRKDKNTVVGTPANKPLKRFVFNKLFDRNSNIDDKRLTEYRNHAK